MAARMYDERALTSALSAYGCKHSADLGNGAHLWVTGWDEPFVLFCDLGYYDEHQYAKALAFVATTMPGDDWSPGKKK